MPELIDRQAALKKLCETCGYCERSEKAMRSTHPDFVAGKCNNYRFLAELQTIKPEVRHGRWVQQESPNGKHFNCSECGHEFTVPCSEMIDSRDYVCYLDDYCGKCGSRMDLRTPTEAQLDMADSVMMKEVTE